MTDLTDILDSAAGEHVAPTPAVVREDLVRGRRALVRRRWTRTSVVAAGALAAAAVGVGLVGPGLGGGDAPRDVQAAADPAPAGVPLVPFDAGPTPKPISPGLVPEGWSVSGNEFALVIAPPGMDTSPDDFIGKLVVMLSPDQTRAAGALPIQVGDVRGTVSHEGPTTLLLYTPGGGQQVVVQAPSRLGWDDATVAQFAAAVTVGPDAVGGVG